MHRRASLALACLAASCVPRATTPGIGPASRPADPPVRFEYRPPKNPAHQALYAELRERRFLEQFAEALSVLRLPRTLTLSFAGCDGTSNAWYDPESATITFCYEYLAEIRKEAASKPLGRVSEKEASDGPAVFVMLHETGHAVFDLLGVPILGREEDAADAFATVILLRLGRDIALRTLRGTAWQYARGAASHAPDESDFADVHGLDAQRYYNILCLAYGSDPSTFAGAVEEGRLPAERAEGCEEEYDQALYAVHELIAPAIDASAAERLRAKHGSRWETGR